MKLWPDNADRYFREHTYVTGSWGHQDRFGVRPDRTKYTSGTADNLEYSVWSETLLQKQKDNATCGFFIRVSHESIATNASSYGDTSKFLKIMWGKFRKKCANSSWRFSQSNKGKTCVNCYKPGNGGLFTQLVRIVAESCVSGADCIHVYIVCDRPDRQDWPAQGLPVQCLQNTRGPSFRCSSQDGASRILGQLWLRWVYSQEHTTSQSMWLEFCDPDSESNYQNIQVKTKTNSYKQILCEDYEDRLLSGRLIPCTVHQA